MTAHPDLKPIGIIIYCPDPRDPLREEIERQLVPDQKDQFVFISVLGGPIALAYAKELKIDYNYLVSQILFAVKVFPTISQIILVGHDCGYYANISDPHYGTGVENKRHDLLDAKLSAKYLFTKLHVSAFFYEVEKNGLNPVE